MNIKPHKIKQRKMPRCCGNCIHNQWADLIACDLPRNELIDFNSYFSWDTVCRGWEHDARYQVCGVKAVKDMKSEELK